ncbi:protein AGENET DOMAIN (AGD)-CONTAINING P1-like [Rutidosis leptorrhynchoides]|uniref:protein AGENET DOMAIN (AGD)-CONTAINING P1-like n=1 Tax=Rutidosis leptorrhynchoides TaxID=125765 RepID=UPI003A995B1C
MKFARGNLVEISSKEKGLKGSYYPAVIITYLSNNEYIVQYRTLLAEDGLSPLREVIPADEIRPAPDEIPVTGFSVGDLVDAYDRDGWWVGKINRIKGSNYYVYFKRTDEKIAYSLSSLRVHQRWVNGSWQKAEWNYRSKIVSVYVTTRVNKGRMVQPKTVINNTNERAYSSGFLTTTTKT